jgi:hypothetical protein
MQPNFAREESVNKVADIIWDPCSTPCSGQFYSKNVNYFVKKIMSGIEQGKWHKQGKLPCSAPWTAFQCFKQCDLSSKQIVYL